MLPNTNISQHFTVFNKNRCVVVVTLTVTSDDLSSTVSNASSGNLPPLDPVTRGSVCVTQDTAYRQWNRALVVDILDNSQVTVLYVDYGKLFYQKTVFLY